MHHALPVLVLALAVVAAPAAAGGQVLVDVRNVRHVLLPGEEGEYSVVVRGVADDAVYGIATRANQTNMEYLWATEYPGGLPKLEVRRGIERNVTIRTRAPECARPGDHALYFNYEVTSPVPEAVPFSLHSVFIVDTRLRASLEKERFGPREPIYVPFAIRQPVAGEAYNASLVVLGPGRQPLSRVDQPADLSCDAKGEVRWAVQGEAPAEGGRYTARLEVDSGGRLVDYVELPFSVVHAEEPVFSVENYTDELTQYDPFRIEMAVGTWRDILQRDNRISVALVWNDTAVVNRTVALDEACENVLDDVRCRLDLGLLHVHEYSGTATFTSEGEAQEVPLKVRVRSFAPTFTQFRPLSKDLVGNGTTAVLASLSDPGLPFELAIRCGPDEAPLPKRCTTGEYGVERCNVTLPPTAVLRECLLIGRIRYRGLEAGNGSVEVILHPRAQVCEVGGLECGFVGASLGFALAAFLLFVRWRAGGAAGIARFRFVVESEDLRRRDAAGYIKRFEEAFWYLGW